jgi:L,D-transpeptidase ErfK/SrfK
VRQVVLVLVLILGLAPAFPAGAAGPYAVAMPNTGTGVDAEAVTVVGQPQYYTIKKGDSLLELARDYGLGFSELGVLYRGWDPFIPPVGAKIMIPTRWIVPERRNAQLIVNTGEMRLYYFTQNGTRVTTYPIGMGVLDFKTPSGSFKVIEKKVKPAWHIPKTLQAKYGMAVMPPGEDNPLGDFKLTLSWGDYGIHGTHMPLGVGRLVSHGCTRMYPEHIEKLFKVVPVGTVVEYIYEPAKIGFLQGRIFLEVHEDVYFKIPSMLLHVLKMLENRGLLEMVDMNRVLRTVEEKTGVPVEISKRGEGLTS